MCFVSKIMRNMDTRKVVFDNGCKIRNNDDQKQKSKSTQWKVQFKLAWHLTVPKKAFT